MSIIIVMMMIMMAKLMTRTHIMTSFTSNDDQDDNCNSMPIIVNLTICQMLIWARVLIGMVIMIMIIKNVDNLDGQIKVIARLLLMLMISHDWCKGQREDYGCYLDYLQDIDTSNGHDGDKCCLCFGKCQLCKVS